jgi:5-methylcytosine-specific restriction protein A
MPWSAKPGCRYPLCPERAVSAGYCAQHKSEHNRTVRERATSHQDCYDWRWRRYSQRRLRQYPLCEECQRNGRIAAANVTDHIVPHRGDQQLFWDPINHESKCVACHNAKSATEVIHRDGR